MTVKELRALLDAYPPLANVLIDVKPWDEALNLAPITKLHGYGLNGSKPFVTVGLDISEATRLDPDGEG